MFRFDISVSKALSLPIVVIVVVNVGFSFAFLAGCSKPVVEENHDLREKGLALVHSGKLKEAASLFNEKLAQNDNSADAHYGLGSVYSAEREEDKAIAEFNRAIALNPRFEEAYNDRGNQYKAKAMYEQAISDYTKAIEIGPHRYLHWYLRSAAYRQKGDFAKARMDATEAIARGNRYVPAYICRARAEQALNLKAEAKADLDIALSLPTFSKYELDRLAEYLWEEGDASSAVKQYDKIIELDPKDHDAYSSRSDCYAAMGDLGKARADLNLAARYAPEPDWYKVSFKKLNSLDYDAAHGVSLPVRWALACSALMFTNHGDGNNSLLGKAPSKDSIDRKRESLSSQWGINSREDLLRVLNDLATDSGHNSSWQEYMKYQKTGVNPLQMLDFSRDIAHGVFYSRLAVVSEYGTKFGDRGILAWDLCRYVCLVRWGLRLGYITEKEAIEMLMPAARRLQKTYGSWKQMGEEYLVGRRFWDEQHWKKDDADYTRIYKLLLTEKNSPWVKIPWNLDLGD
ncbi:hypothetical protein BH11CYA1_BH11CYA1_16980 [soil metagenome]